MVYKKRKTDIVSLIKRMLDLILLFEVENIFLLRMRSHESRKKNTPGQLFHTKVYRSNEGLAFTTSTQKSLEQHLKSIFQMCTNIKGDIPFNLDLRNVDYVKRTHVLPFIFRVRLIAGTGIYKDLLLGCLKSGISVG